MNKVSAFSATTLLLSALVPHASLNARPLGNLESEIKATLDANHSARTILEWKSSGKTPEDLFERVQNENSPQAWQELCSALRGLSEPNLALFEEAIENHAAAAECRQELLDRLEAHWNTFRKPAPFAPKELNVMPDSDSQDPQNSDTTDNTSTLPNIEVTIDPAQIPALANADLPQGQIAITLDDGPHPTRTARILDILQANGVRANFFEIGQNAQNYPDISKQVVAAGHIVGSHTWDHANLPTLSLDAAKDEILNGRDAVNTATGTEIPFFRFPYGASNPALRSFVQGLGITRFFWNMDSLDWKITDPDQLLQNALSELDREGRGIILFHDIHEQTVLVLPRFLAELKNRGFTTVVFVPKQ